MPVGFLITSTFQLLERDVAKQLLTCEGEWRASAYWQARYAAVDGHTDVDWIDVTDELQQALIAGVTPGDSTAEFREHALHVLRSYQSLFPHDAELFALVPYLQHNRCRRGELKPGDALPQHSIQLHALSSDLVVEMRDLASTHKPTLWIASSLT